MAKADVWMPLYIADYHKDTSRLTCEQHGAYMLLIMDLWTGGPIPDDDVSLAQVARLELKRWKQHRPTLERFFRVVDGVWRHKRVDREREKAQELAERRRQNGALGGRPKKQDGTGEKPATEPRRNLEVSVPDDQPGGLEKSCLARPSPSPTSEPNGSSESPPPEAHPPKRRSSADSDLDAAVEAYNLVAAELKLPKAKVLTAERRKRLRARLAEHGLEGWREAMDGLRAPFCRGENDRGWRADFDFCLQPKSLAKLAEHAFDGVEEAATGPPVARVDEGFAARQLARLQDAQ